MSGTSLSPFLAYYSYPVWKLFLKNDRYLEIGSRQHYGVDSTLKQAECLMELCLHTDILKADTIQN